MAIIIFLITLQSWQNSNFKIRRIIVKEYPGGTIIPRIGKNEKIECDLFDGRFLKINLKDIRGKMHLKCYSKDSFLVEEGNYENSLAILKKYTYGIGAGSGKTTIAVTEYYEPLRNGTWIIYDTTKKLFDTIQYKNGLKI